MKVQRQVTSVNPQRTLLIGLGGSGAEVLIRTRRLLIDRFGKLENVPIVRCVYVDTDPTWWQEHVSVVEEHVRLREETEYVDAQFPDASTLYAGIKQGNFPNYHWFSIDKLEQHRSVTAGAGTVRQLGRLCFWQHFTAIRDTIRQALTNIVPDSTAQFMSTHYGMQVDSGVTVHIIGGLAGGTGSGMFLDAAYLARRLLQTLGVVGVNQINGYLILPQAFRDLKGANALANGYAALKELNYHSYMYAADNALASVFGRPVWDADYLRDDVNRVAFELQPPFEHCYLIDARNEHIDLHRDDIFAMLARSLFQEVTLAFSAFKRSLRANIRNRIVKNDGADCPVQFMSFGQSAVVVPHKAIKQVLAHQLALQAVQQWIDKTAEPVRVYGMTADPSGAEPPIEQTVASIQQAAADPDLVTTLRTYLVKEFIPANGLKREAVIAAIVEHAHERLTDVPYALREAIKQQWLSEKWDYKEFIPRLTAAWEEWRTDFNDENSDHMQWGEQIRKVEGNMGRALDLQRKRISEAVYQAFADPQRYGPAWALCMVQQLRSGMGKLKDDLIKQANDPVVIATALGDVTLINAMAGGGGGPSLSAVIEGEIGKALERVRAAIESHWPMGRRERIEKAGEAYLGWAAHWCRARVEERVRRAAAAMMQSLSTGTLDELERNLREQAAKLAHLRVEMTSRAKAWNEKGLRRKMWE